jgi:hypothetical protein
MPQPDSVLVEVTLSTTAERILVEALAGPDSALQLPAGPIYELLGLGTPPSQWISLTSLQAAFPTVGFIWVRSEMRVAIIDRMEVLPASLRAKTETMSRTQQAITYSLPMQSAPYAALAVDDSLHAMLDAGYSFRGRAAVAGRVDETRAGSWGASVAPNSHVFASYQGGTARPPTVSGRVSAGPFWLSATATPHSPVEMSGLIRFGDVQVFASHDYGVVTWQGSPWTAQVARNWKTGRTATRFSIGPSYASPFSFPITTLGR